MDFRTKFISLRIKWHVAWQSMSDVHQSDTPWNMLCLFCMSKHTLTFSSVWVADSSLKEITLHSPKYHTQNQPQWTDSLINQVWTSTSKSYSELEFWFPKINHGLVNLHEREKRRTLKLSSFHVEGMCLTPLSMIIQIVSASKIQLSFAFPTQKSSKLGESSILYKVDHMA